MIACVLTDKFQLAIEKTDHDAPLLTTPKLFILYVDYLYDNVSSEIATV